MPVVDNPSQSSFTFPGLQIPGLQSPNVNLSGLGNINFNAPNQQAAYQGILGVLGQQPQSLTNTLAPLLSQIFGTQGNLMAPIFQQMGSQNAAQAQSDAMRRGLTGSSIEASNIQQAYNQSNQNFGQYLAGQLSGLGQNLIGTTQFDIGNQNQYLQNLAQLIGQQSSSVVQQNQFAQQLAEALQAAQLQSDASSQAGLFGGLGSALGPAIGVGLKAALA